MTHTIPTLIHLITDRLVSMNETIAIAESVTGGYLQYMLSRGENASKYYEGGITCYNLGHKVKHLNVEPIEAQKHNCVSLQVAIQMAQGAVNMFNSNWGLAITGYATPVARSHYKLYAYYAIVHPNSAVSTGRIEPHPNIRNVPLFYGEILLRRLYETM